MSGGDVRDALALEVGVEECVLRRHALRRVVPEELLKEVAAAVVEVRDDPLDRLVVPVTTCRE